MRKISFIIFIVFTISILFAEGLEVRSFVEDNFDMHGSVSPVRDANGDNCALIRMEHNLVGEVHLTDMEVYKREKKTANIIYFYISKWEQAITISTEKYLPIKYRFSSALEPEKTYVLILFGSGEGDDIEDIPVTITTEPAGATVYINNIRLADKTPVNDFFISGTYPIRIELEQYFTVNESITISPPSIEKNYTLEPDYGLLNIVTLPNAIIYLNNKKISQLKDIKLEPQTLNLRAELPKHKSVEKRLIIKTGDQLIIEIYPEPLTGTILVNPKPADAKIILRGDSGEFYQGNGISKFADIPIGKYYIEISHPQYLTYEETINLEENEREKIEPKLVEAELGFSVYIPQELENELEVVLFDNSENMDEIKLYKQDGKYITGKAGKYIMGIKRGKYLIYTEEISINSSIITSVTPYYKKYLTPSNKSKLYVENSFKEKGKDLLLITKSNQVQVKCKLARYSDYSKKEYLNNRYSEYELQYNKDYFKKWYGIGLDTNYDVIFYGIKIPTPIIVYSPGYKVMNGIDINCIAGNAYFLFIPSLDKNADNVKMGKIGAFNGIAVGWLGVSATYFKGIGIGGFMVETDNDFTGVGIGSLGNETNGSLKGLFLGGIYNGVSGNLTGSTVGFVNVTKEKVTGVQVGFYNQAGSLNGIQLGAINVVMDGEGGALPFFPIINVHF